MQDGELTWSKDVQGLVLGSFFWGYITTQFLGGALSLRIGSSVILGGALLVASVATLLLPTAARLHYGALLGLRVLMGMCQGVVFPATHTLFSRWAPPSERNRLIGLALGGEEKRETFFTSVCVPLTTPFSGANVGSVLSMLLGGVLCSFGFAGGWPSIFYVSGMLGLALTIVWAVFVTDGPTCNRWIKEEEARFVETSLRQRVTQEKVSFLRCFVEAETGLGCLTSVVFSIKSQ